MNNLDIKFECENTASNSLEEALIKQEDEICLNIIINGINIGSISCNVYEANQEKEYLLSEGYVLYDNSFYKGKFLHIELIEIEEEYRGHHYGYYVLEEFKKILKNNNISVIEGECRQSLIKFYSSLGADFTKKSSKDDEYILSRFYIKL